ncbi:hypothetical protein KF093_000985 [Campylobacter coli]|nr:hypothetical protein [Campylobacter coli]
MRKNKDGIEVVKPEKEEKNDRVINSFHDWKSIAAIILSAVLIVGVCLLVFFYGKDKEIFSKNVDTRQNELKNQTYSLR